MMPRFEKHRVRAQSASRAQWHRRLNSVFSRLIARRGNHATLIGLPANDHGLAAQLRPVQQFDGNEKRVHVNVEN